ncbi:hypothetical protein [Nocardia sp. NPDC057440]|uniref:hypothetical protein n=1 Tax=Nocardia sp. NPDC057440 TaxID=3346134 RepID=UPI0036710129
MKTLTVSLLIAGGLIGASAAVAHTDPVTKPAGVVAYFCTSNGSTYDVGNKVSYSDGSYEVCQFDGSWKRVAPPSNRGPGQVTPGYGSSTTGITPGFR